MYFDFADIFDFFVESYANSSLPSGNLELEGAIDSIVNCNLVYENYVNGERLVVTSSNYREIHNRIDDDKKCQDTDSGIVSFHSSNNNSINSFSQVNGVLPKSSGNISGVYWLSESPYSGVCQIFVRCKNSSGEMKTFNGSGCFISENSILTAAHVLVHSDYPIVVGIRIYYCFRVTDSTGYSWGNLGFCSGISSICCSTYSSNQDTMYDYAIINTASYAGQNTGVFKLATITPTTATSVTAIGYPEDGSSEGYTQVLSIPNPIRYSDGNLNKIVSNYYRARYSSVAIEKGMSGGALITCDSSNYYQLLGINVATNTILGIKYSYFCRIEANVSAFCSNWGATGSVPSSLYLTA